MINVQKNGVTQFTADDFAGVSGDAWNFVSNTPPPPPAGRQTSALVTWIQHTNFTQNTDMTEYANVAGVIAPHTPPVQWPYLGGPTFKWQIAAGKYVALAIHVPPAGTPQTTHSIVSPVYSGSNPFKVSISRTAGDFNPDTCLVLKDNCRPDDSTIFYFRNGAGNAYYIGLPPGETVYMNLAPDNGTLVQTIALLTR